MNYEEIKSKIETYKNQGLKLFTTSSFQSHSVVLLHILSKIDNTIPVYFINTGFLFPETIQYRDQIAELFNLNVKNVFSTTPKSMQKDEQGRFYFTSDPDYCCHINKVEPLEPIMAEYDVWINGVRADQSAVRKSFNIEEKAPHGVLRFHPMLDWNSMQIQRYLSENNIPRHPLEDKGYLSIGCEPCTRKFSMDLSEREVRWYGLNKTECGLNTELVSK
ncbi:MAG: phosphoadenylyl-sulfate reductase [Bacteroidota bacterium]|nr:phosphoadenylyl-sulfate reductase [Bacteroidota bacterium]